MGRVRLGWRNAEGALRRKSVLGQPRVDDPQASSHKWAGVASGYDQTMRAGNGGNVTVGLVGAWPKKCADMRREVPECQLIVQWFALEPVEKAPRNGQVNHVQIWHISISSVKINVSQPPPGRYARVAG